MGLGAAIFLFVVGAIFAFATDWQIAGLDIVAVGWILMLASVVWATLVMYFWRKRRTARRREVIVEKRVPRTVIEEERVVRHPVDNDDGAGETRRVQYDEHGIPR